MLQGGWISKQKVSVKQLNKIKPFLQEIRNDYSPRLIESLQQIINFYLGTPDEHGILYRFGNQFSNYQPMQWASQLQKLLENIVPQSPAFNQLLKRNKDINAQITIPNSYLPHYLDPNSSDKTRFVNFRITHNGISLAPLDAFYMMLAYALYHSQTIAFPTTQYQHLVLDDFYSSLSRNPLLILLRKNLEYFSNREKNVIQKIVEMLRIYFVDEVLIKYELDRNKSRFEHDVPRILNQSQDSMLSFTGSKKQIQLKYRLKPHHLHALYLVLKFAPQYLSNQFSKYCQALIEYYSYLRPDQFCLQALVRLWIYGMSIKNEDNIENEVIRALENSNSKDGWFYLKRYSPTSIYITDSLSVYNIQTALNILKLLEKQSFWLANPSYLFTFSCFFRLLRFGKIFYHEFANTHRTLTSEGRQNSLIEKIFRIIVVRFNQNLVDILSKIRKNNPKEYIQSVQTIRNYEEIIEQYFVQYVRSKNMAAYGNKSTLMRQSDGYLPQQFKFKQVKEADLISAQENSNIISLDPIDKINSQSKRNLVAFYRRQPKGCWQTPIQYNESMLLYYVWFTIAKIIDFVIPGKREQPFLNIRFLANPITFFGVAAILIMIFLLFR